MNSNNVALHNFWTIYDLFNYSNLFYYDEAVLLERFLINSMKKGKDEGIKNNTYLEIVGKKYLYNIRQAISNNFKRSYDSNNYILIKSNELMPIIDKIYSNEELEQTELDNFIAFITSNLLVIKNMVYGDYFMDSLLETDNFREFLKCITSDGIFHIKTKNTNLILDIKPNTNIIIMANEKLKGLNVNKVTITLLEDEPPHVNDNDNDSSTLMELSYIEMKKIKSPWHHLVVTEYMKINKLSNINDVDTDGIYTNYGATLKVDKIFELVQKYGYKISPEEGHKYWDEIDDYIKKYYEEINEEYYEEINEEYNEEYNDKITDNNNDLKLLNPEECEIIFECDTKKINYDINYEIENIEYGYDDSNSDSNDE